MRRALLLLTAALLAWGCGGSEPSAPVNLAVKALSPWEMEVTWEPAHKWQEIEGYRVYRDGAFYQRLAAPGLVDTGLTNATTYCYAVSAVGDGNESAKAGPECDTTPAVLDIEPPSTPAALLANAVGSDRIDLSWEASFDNVGVTGYNIYNAVSQTLIDDTIAAGFIHNGLSPSTEYCYFVTAFDDSDNESLGSIINCAATDPAP